MKGTLASSLGMTLGLLAAAGHAQEAKWRAAKPREPQQATTAPVTPAPAPPSTAAPVAYVAPAPMPAAVVTAATMARWLGEQPRPEPAPAPDPAVVQVSTDAVRWVTARAKLSADDGPELKKTPAVPGTLPVAPQTAQAIPATAYPGGYPCYILPDPCAAAAERRAPRFLFSAEYLAWWVKGAEVPPLLTTSPPPGVNGVNGALPGSTVLLSGDDLDTTFRQGARFGTVFWLDECASCGFDGRLFFTGRIVNRFAVDSGMVPNLFRPFTAANPGLGQFSEQVTAAGQTIGGFRAENRSFFWGAEANYRDNVCCGCNFRTDLIAGFRYLNLDERLTIIEDFTRLTPRLVQDFPGGRQVVEPVGTRVIIRDQFATRNDFYGGQLGLVSEYRRDRWSIDLRTAVTLGGTHQELRIDGTQVRTIPGQPSEVFVGGLLALNTNIGVRSRDVFSVVPEAGVNVGYQLTDHLKAFVGYNFLFWSNVIRPGDQIDTVIDVNRVPRFVPPGVVVPDAGVNRPAVLFRETDFWAQGINVGFEFRW
jgi:Putative beta barrel porin-7 (BBP7)